MTDAVLAQSEAAIVKGSSSFEAASRLFGRRLREDVWQFYAWCRYCDDQIDGQDGGGASVVLSAAERERRLQRLRRLTRGALAGEPLSEPAFEALARVARRHAIPERWALELLDGFAQDVEAAPFADQAATLRYCWGVAGSVGVMMALIMGVQDLAVLRRAQDLGLAFQLTNICRDVAEDARNGRVYLPQAELRQAGAPGGPAAMVDPTNREAVFAVVRAQLALAERYYRSARVGLRDLPFRAALAVAAARDVYREIGRQLLRRGPEGLAVRTRLSRPRMALRLARGLGVALWSRVERLARPAARPDLWSRL